MKYTVALIYGGEGYERDVSRKSRDNLRTLIDDKRFDVKDVYISESGEWFLTDAKESIPTFPILKNGKHGLSLGDDVLKIDAAIPCLHGDLGEDGVIAGALAAAHIPTVSEDVYASALCADKAYTKAVCEWLSIPTARWRLSVGEEPECALIQSQRILSFPMFIKPARLGSSFGASPANNSEEFLLAFSDAKGLCRDRILIEQRIDIKYELECALYGAGERKILPAGAIRSNGIFYDFKAKYNSNEIAADVVAGFDKSTEAILAAEYAKRLADFIGLERISRIDFFVTRDGGVLFNEINTFPGMTKTSLYPKMAEPLSEGKGFINELVLAVMNARSV